MTPEQLKNSILQLAIQGKLVKQRKEEGTGEELFKEMQEEKQKLIAEGKLKKQKNLPEITEDKIPFDIPETWKWVRLGEIGFTQTGNTPSKTHSEYFGSYIPFIGPGDIDNSIINYLNKGLSSEGLKFGRIATKNSILQVCIGGSIGKCCLIDRDVCFNQQINAIYPSISDKKFVFHLLNSPYFKNFMIDNAGGTATPIINRTVWDSIIVPLPPLAEQKRIVEKIEELLPLVDRYEKAWSRLEELNKKFPLDMQKSILQEAIQGKLVKQRKEEGTGEELFKEIQEEKQKLIAEGKLKKQKNLPEITEDEIPFDIPETWKWVRLGEIGDWGSGATPSRTNADFYGGDIPWLKTGDLTDGYIYNVPEYITKFALEKTSVRLNPKGSILIAMYGATIGKLGILTKAMTTNQACCACIVFPNFYNLYLFYFLLANRNSFIKQGEGGAQPNISKDKIINTLIPLPPLAEQKRIVEKIEEFLPLCEKLK